MQLGILLWPRTNKLDKKWFLLAHIKNCSQKVHMLAALYTAGISKPGRLAASKYLRDGNDNVSNSLLLIFVNVN